MNQFMYMDDIKLFSKNKKNWILIQTIRIYKVIGMKLAIEKCALLIMKS